MKRATLLGLLLPLIGWAEAPLVPPAVACLSLRDAKDYHKFSQEAPDFAADLLARAACYRVQNPTEALPLGRPEQGFQAYRLLSGHRIWVPAKP